MTDTLSEDYVKRRAALRQQSQAIYQTILSANYGQFESLLAQMTKYCHHEMRMLWQGCFMNFEYCDKSPWLLLFSSEEYLSKLLRVIKLFGPHLPICTKGMNSLFRSISPLTVSLQAGASVLSAVINQVPNVAGCIIAQSAELLRAAIQLTSNEETIAILKLLYQNNVNFNAKSSIHRGETALIFATRSNRELPVTWLIGHGIDLNIQDDLGFTALHYATTTDISCLDLLEAGADPNIQSHTGVTALLLLNNIYCRQLKDNSLISKAFYNNKKMRILIDIAVLKQLYQFGGKVLLAQSQENPNFQCSAISIEQVDRQRRITAEVDISVPVLFNSYDSFVHIPLRENPMNSINQICRMRRRLLSITVKHGYPVSSLRFQTADADYKDLFEDFRSTIYYLLRYFQKPYPVFIVSTVVNLVEKLILRYKTSIPPNQSCFDYIIETVLEIGLNSKYSDSTLSLYYNSICLILQLLSSYRSKAELALFNKVCRYLELTVYPYWYNKMLATKGCNDPNNNLCICIGAWMSLFLFIWHQSLEPSYEAAFQMLDRFYKRINTLCSEFQPLICMMLYATSYYYTSKPTQSYDYDTFNTNPFLKTISSYHTNFIEDTILLLTSLGEDINSPTFYRKQTALLIAVESNANGEFIKFLLEQGASPYAVDTLGCSVKEYCEIGLVSASLIPMIDKITVKPYPLQVLCVKCLSYHKVKIGNLLEHKALRRLLIVFT